MTKSGTEVRLPALHERLAQAVSSRVGAGRYALWFNGQARFVGLGGEVVVVARNLQSQDWLEDAFGDAVRAAAVEICGPQTQVRWVVDANLFNGSESETESRAAAFQRRETLPPVEVPPVSSPRLPAREVKETPPPAGRTSRRSAPVAVPPPAPPAVAATPRQVDLFGQPVPPPPPKAKSRRLEEETEQFHRGAAPRATRRWRSLNDFIVGASNRVAYASAMSVVEDPAGGANPLVIHGPVGTGKTHLLEGIHGGLRKKWTDARPCYVTAEDFTNRFVQAMRLGKISAFRRQYRDCSALLLDDLHFLATKRATQEEFLHTLDALVSDGRQVVVTTDCHPRLADELMPELTDRLLGGAVWGLLPPDPETRLEILRSKSMQSNQPAIPDAMLKFVASHLRGNVRELEGAVNCVRHYSRVTGRVVDHGVVREALGDLLRHAVRVVTMPDVDAAVCGVLRLPAGTLQSKGRSWAISHPRMIATFLCRKHTAATYGEISKFFASKTHSTAVSSEKKVRTWLDRDTSISIGDREWRVKDLIDRVERDLQR